MANDADFAYSIVIDDDPMIAPIIESITKTKVFAYTTLASFEAHQRSDTPKAVFVDIHLGLEENGIDLIPSLRTRWPYCPILVVTTDPSGDAVGLALAAGAHDFLRKPFDHKELTARLRARSIELAEKQGHDSVTIGDFILNLHLSELTGPKGSVFLSQSDARLLQYLGQSNGTIVSRQELKRKIWGNVVVSDNALDKKLYDIRSAIKDVGSQIKLASSYRKGFSLIVPGTAGTGQTA